MVMMVMGGEGWLRFSTRARGEDWSVDGMGYPVDSEDWLVVEKVGG